jgi:hypothetical protein
MFNGKVSVQSQKILRAAEPKNYTGAAMTAKYVSLKNYKRLTIIINTGAWAGGTAAVTLSQATKVDATGAKALAFDTQYNDETTTDTLAAVAVAANTFNLGTANKCYVIEVDAEKLDVSNGFDCVTLAIASPGANADFYGVSYVLSGSRFEQSTPPSAVVD